MRVLIRRADGSIEAAVRSERSNELYEVSTGPPSAGKAIAKCSCVDFRKRGGLCKHGAAAWILLLQEQGRSRELVRAGLSADTLPETASTPDFRRRRVMASSGPRPSPKRARCSFKSASASSDGIDDIPEPDEAHSSVPTPPPPPPLVRPRFPQGPVGCSGVPGAPQRLPQRKKEIKAALSARLLLARAGAGDDAGFVAELHRWGTAPLDDVGLLLHKAVHCDNEVGAVAVVMAILARPEGASVVNAQDSAGRTLLHTAVAAQRLAMCRALLGCGADPTVRDRAGHTPLALARTRRLDASMMKLEDPFVELLLCHSSKAGGGGDASADSSACAGGA